jgi:hypothetical protein
MHGRHTARARPSRTTLAAPRSTSASPSADGGGASLPSIPQARHLGSLPSTRSGRGGEHVQ